MLKDELENPWAYGSIAITTIPLRDSSIDIFERASFERWNPGITITKGAGVSLVAVFGLNRSATNSWPFCIGNFIVFTSTLPPELWIIDAMKLETIIAVKRNTTLKRLVRFCF